jgi:hypothetical protein
MAKRLTEKKRAFLENYNVTNSVTAAAEAAGYTQAGPCYKLVRKDANGVYVDETTRQFLAQLNGLALPTAPPKVKRMADVVRLVKFQAPETSSEVPTLDEVRAYLWSLANAPNTSDGPRVQALSLLMKDLKEEAIPAPPDPEDVLRVVRTKLSVANE